MFAHGAQEGDAKSPRKRLLAVVDLIPVELGIKSQHKASPHTEGSEALDI